MDIRKGPVLILLFFLFNGISKGFDNSNREKHTGLTPMVNEMNYFRNELNAIMEDIKTLYYGYGTSDFIDMPRGKLGQIELNLRQTKTIFELQERTSILLQKYLRHLKDLQRFELKTGQSDFVKTMQQRSRIWNKIENMLNLTIFEIRESMKEEEENTPVNHYQLKNIPLLNIAEGGNYCKMMKQDLHFIDNLKSFMGISVELFEYRLDVEGDL